MALLTLMMAWMHLARLHHGLMRMPWKPSVVGGRLAREAFPCGCMSCRFRHGESTN